MFTLAGISSLTALRQVRAKHIHISRLSSFQPPDKPPAKGEIRSGLQELRTQLYGLELELPIHVAIKTTSGYRSNKARAVHGCGEPYAPYSFVQLTDEVYACGPELALVQRAVQLRNRVATLELAFELCGSYQTEATGVEEHYQVDALTTRERIEDVVRQLKGLRGLVDVLWTLRYLRNCSGSVQESKVAILLGLPMQYGGYGLGMPEMNYPIYASDRAYSIMRSPYFKADLCWPRSRIVVEYLGRSHENEEQMKRDCVRRNMLEGLGWRVVSLTRRELGSKSAMDYVARTLHAFMGTYERVRVSDYEERQIELRKTLNLGDYGTTWHGMRMYADELR